MNYYKPLNPNAKNCLSCGELVEDGSDSDYCGSCWEDQTTERHGPHHHWNPEQVEADEYGIDQAGDESYLQDNAQAELDRKHIRWHLESLDMDEYGIYPSSPTDRRGNIKELRF